MEELSRCTKRRERDYCHFLKQITKVKDTPSILLILFVGLRLTAVLAGFFYWVFVRRRCPPITPRVDTLTYFYLVELVSRFGEMFPVILWSRDVAGSSYQNFTLGFR